MTTTTTTTKTPRKRTTKPTPTAPTADELAEGVAEAKRWTQVRNERIAAALAAGEMTVAEIAEATGLSTVRVRSLRDYTA